MGAKNGLSTFEREISRNPMEQDRIYFSLSKYLKDHEQPEACSICDSAYCSLETHIPVTPEFICKPNKTGKIYDTEIIVYEESSTESPNNE